MVFNVENKKIKIVIPENETYVHITKKCEDYEIIFHDNVESLSIDDDCDFSIEKIKSLNIKNLKNLKLGMRESYVITGFDKLELLVIPYLPPKTFFNTSLKIDNPSLKTILLSPYVFDKNIFFEHSIENVYSYLGSGCVRTVFNKEDFEVKYFNDSEFNCIFFNGKACLEHVTKLPKVSKSELFNENTKLKLELEKYKLFTNKLKSELESILLCLDNIQ